MQDAGVELARYVLWAAIVGLAVAGGAAAGSVLHTFEHPDQPLVVGPSAIVRAAYDYARTHGDFPPDGPVRAHDGSRTAWDDVLIANDRCAGGGAYSFKHVRGMLQIACDSDVRVYVEAPERPVPLR